MRGDLEIGGLLSVLYRETGRLLALATDIPDRDCGYIAKPEVIELPGEDPRTAARWEVAWAKDRMAAVSYDESTGQWLTGFAAAEQAIIAAAHVLTVVKGDKAPIHADRHACAWDEAARALQLAQRLLDEARAGRTHTTTPSDET